MGKSIFCSQKLEMLKHLLLGHEVQTKYCQATPNWENPFQTTFLQYIKDTLKTFDDFKNKEKSVWSNFFYI